MLYATRAGITEVRFLAASQQYRSRVRTFLLRIAILRTSPWRFAFPVCSPTNMGPAGLAAPLSGTSTSFRLRSSGCWVRTMPEASRPSGRAGTSREIAAAWCPSLDCQVECSSARRTFLRETPTKPTSPSRSMRVHTCSSAPAGQSTLADACTTSPTRFWERQIRASRWGCSSRWDIRGTDAGWVGETASHQSTNGHLHHEILRVRMMHHDGGRTLLGVKQKARRQLHADCLVGMQQRKQLGLVFEVRTRRITERIPRSTIFLVEQVANVGRVVAGNAKILAHSVVREFGKRFGGFDTQAVQIQVLRVLSTLEQFLRLMRRSGADGNAGHAQHVHLSAGSGKEVVGDAQVASFFLTREGKPQRLSGNWISLHPALGQRVHDSVIALALSAEIAVHHLRLEPARRDDFLLQLFQDWPIFRLD